MPSQGGISFNVGTPPSLSSILSSIASIPKDLINKSEDKNTSSNDSQEKTKANKDREEPLPDLTNEAFPEPENVTPLVERKKKKRTKRTKMAEILSPQGAHSTPLIVSYDALPVKSQERREEKKSSTTSNTDSRKETDKGTSVEDEMKEETNRVYRELEAFRRNNESGIVQIKGMIHRLEKWKDHVYNETSPHIPAQWKTELMTSYLEMKISQRMMEEGQVLEFVRQHWMTLHHLRTFSMSNQNKMKQVVHYFIREYRQGVSTLKSCTSTEVQSTDIQNEKVAGHLAAENYRQALRTLQKSNNLIVAINHLPTLIEHLASHTIDYCVLQYPQISPWNVLEAVHYDPMSFKPLSASPNVGTLLQYISSLFRYHPEAERDVQLLHLYLECNLIDGAPTLEDHCHYHPTEGVRPKRKAHEAKWRHGDEIMRIITNKERYPYDDIQVVVLFEKYAFFSGLVQLYLQSTQWRKAVDLILAMDDTDTFMRLVRGHHDRYDWNHVLSLMLNATRERGEEETDINLELVLDVMMTCLGSHQTLQLIEGHHHHHDLIPVSSLRKLVEVSRLEREKDDTTHELLETLNTYYYSPRSPFVPPQIVQLLQRDLRGEKNDRVETLEEGFTSMRWYEEGALHWGSLYVPSSCPLCSYNTSTTSLGSIQVFTCGHAYHERCLQDRDACEVCFASNFQSVLD